MKQLGMWPGFLYLDRLIMIHMRKRITMPTFEVRVTIENKPGLSDPEGDTILNDLVLKDSGLKVKKIKTAKMLKFTVEDEDKKAATERVKKACDDLRIYNPIVSTVSFTVSEDD